MGGGLLGFPCCLLLQKLNSTATLHWKHPGNKKFCSPLDGCRNKPGPRATAELTCAFHTTKASHKQSTSSPQAHHYSRQQVPCREGQDFFLRGKWEKERREAGGVTKTTQRICVGVQLRRHASLAKWHRTDIIPVPPALLPPNSWLRRSLWQPERSWLSCVDPPRAANWSSPFQVGDGDGFHRLYWLALVSLRGLLLICLLELVTDFQSEGALYIHLPIYVEQ